MEIGVTSCYLYDSNKNSSLSYLLGKIKRFEIENISNNTVYFITTLTSQNNNNIRKQLIERVFNKYMRKKLDKNIDY